MHTQLYTTQFLAPVKMKESELSTQAVSSPINAFDRGSLLVRHLQGDMDAFPEIVALYKSSVYSYLSRCGVERSFRDDLFQEIFLKIHRFAHSYQADKSFNPWLYTIVANTVRSYHRKTKINVITFEEKIGLREQNSSHDLIENRETIEWLEQALQKLPMEQREALLLSTVGELEQSEVAQVLGVPVNTVKTYVRRARISLAKDLARRKAQIQHEVMR